ncbi:Dihydroxyacetone phosphatase [Tessaracoccus sp. O5.2]|uniref:HAD-IIA family hydrolase n=1 Tax=Tessaracoccus sp. O5.2 TaxID=3157622 RepID=UPI0035E54241
MRTRAEIKAWLTDMDGVLVHDNRALPGAQELIDHWVATGTPFLVLTNNATYTPRDLSARLRDSGLNVPEERIWTSAMATAKFLAEQKPGGSCFMVGEAGLSTALHDAGMVLSDRSPDFVVIGDTRTYSFEAITTAIRLIDAGARFIATNPDATGPTPTGVVPATGAVAALITKATGREPYVVGKPNPMMFRSALNKIGAHSEETGMIGDRMDTDIVAGMEAGLHTVLVLTGISTVSSIAQFPYRPVEILDGVHQFLDGAVPPGEARGHHPEPPLS